MNVKKLIGIRFSTIVVNLGSILYFTYICTCNPAECCKQEFNCNINITENDDRLILSHSITILACALMCLNGGTRNETTCTCDCADGYSGDTCGSECIMGHIDSCSLLLMEYAPVVNHISMRMYLNLHLKCKL